MERSGSNGQDEGDEKNHQRTDLYLFCVATSERHHCASDPDQRPATHTHAR